MLYGAELLAGAEPQQVREFSVAQLLCAHVSLQGTELRKTPGLVGSSDPLSQHGCQLLGDEIAQLRADIRVLRSCLTVGQDRTALQTTENRIGKSSFAHKARQRVLSP